MIKSYPGHNHILPEVLRLLTNSVPGFDCKAWITMLTTMSTSSLFLYMVHSVCQMPAYKFVRNVRARPLSFTDSIASTIPSFEVWLGREGLHLQATAARPLMLPDLLQFAPGARDGHLSLPPGTYRAEAANQALRFFSQKFLRLTHLLPSLSQVTGRTSRALIWS